MPVYKGSTEIVPSPPGNYNPLGEELAIFKGTDIVYAMMPVSFDEQGGSTVSDKDVYYNDTYGSLPTSTKSYYDLDGWFTASSGGSEVLSTTTVTETFRHTLYAQWSPNATGYYISVNDNTLNYFQTTYATGNYYSGAAVPSSYYWYTSGFGSGAIELTNTTSSTVTIKNTNTSGSTDTGTLYCRYLVDGQYIYKSYTLYLYSGVAENYWQYVETASSDPGLDTYIYECYNATEAESYAEENAYYQDYDIGDYIAVYDDGVYGYWYIFERI